MPLAGGLRDRVTIQEGTAVKGAVGQKNPVWTNAETRWARIIPISERVQWLQESARPMATHKIVFRGALSFTLKTSRFLHEGKVYVPVAPEADPIGNGAFTTVLVVVDPEAKP